MHAGAKLNAEHVKGPAKVVAGKKAEKPHAQGCAFRWSSAEPRRTELGRLTITADAGFSRHPLSGSSSSFTYAASPCNASLRSTGR